MTAPVRVAVTGAAGRVGRGVVELLSKHGKEVVAVDAVAGEPAGDGVVWAQLDMADYDAVVKAFDGCDGVVHLAAIARPGLVPDSVVHANNVVASYNAMRAAVEVGVKRICQASSINAIGGGWSRLPRFDYFPLDEDHPTYAEDPYSLSKWVCEQQASSLARRYSTVGISSLRFHMVAAGRAQAAEVLARAPEAAVRNLWGYTSLAAAAGACLLALEGERTGHKVFLIVAPEQLNEAPSMEVAARFYPDVPLRHPLSGDEGFFDCSKAAGALGWQHDGW